MRLVTYERRLKTLTFSLSPPGMLKELGIIYTITLLRVHRQGLVYVLYSPATRFTGIRELDCRLIRRLFSRHNKRDIRVEILPLFLNFNFFFQILENISINLIYIGIELLLLIDEQFSTRKRSSTKL